MSSDLFASTLGKRVSENYLNLSEFWRPIAEQLFSDRFRGFFGANSTNSTSTVFVAIHTKSKILIGLELLISFINTVTAWRRLIWPWSLCSWISWATTRSVCCRDIYSSILSNGDISLESTLLIGVMIRDNRRIEWLKISSPAVTSVEVFSTVFMIRWTKTVVARMTTCCGRDYRSLSRFRDYHSRHCWGKE